MLSPGEAFFRERAADAIAHRQDRAFLLIVGHSGHAMGWRLAAKRGHDGVVHWNEIADDDGHGAVAQEFSCGVVVRRGYFEDVARGELVASSVEEQHGGHAEQFAVVVYFGLQSGHRLFACDVFEC